MGGFAALFAPSGARALDQRDFGRQRSRGSRLVGLIFMIVVAVVACWVCWAVGTREASFYLPAISGIPPHRVFYNYVAPWAFDTGLALFAILPLSYLTVLFGIPTIIRASRARRRARDRQRWSAPLTATLDAVADGQWVRVRGRVVRGGGFTSAGGRAGTVIASCLGSIGDIAGGGQSNRCYWELHGANFRIVIDPGRGEEAQVQVENATLVDGPTDFPAEILSRRPFAPRERETDGTRAPGGRHTQLACLYDEQTIAAGEWIEVLGAVHRQVDPSADAAPRGARLQAQLVSTPSHRLLIRAVASP